MRSHPLEQVKDLIERRESLVVDDRNVLFPTARETRARRKGLGGGTTLLARF